MTTILASTTEEKLDALVTCSADPTGTAPGWAFTAGAVTPTVWEDGEWQGTWADVRSQVDVVTPTLVGAGATISLAVGVWAAWVRITVDSELIVRRVGTVTVV